MKITKSYFAFIIIFLGGMVFIIFSIYAPKPIRVDMTTKGILWQNNNPGYTKEIDVVLNGSYSSNEYTGSIYCSDGAYNIIIDHNVSVLFNNNIGIISYYDNENDIVKNIGMLICNKDFSQVSILPYFEKSNWDGSTCYIITLPCKRRDDALTIMRKLASQNNWLSQNQWK